MVSASFFLCFFFLFSFDSSRNFRKKQDGLPLISQMARQHRLTKAQFLDFIDCTVSEEDYRAILREQDMMV